MTAARWLYDDNHPVIAPVATAQAVTVGDLIGTDSAGTSYRAEDQTWDTSLAVTQAAFVAAFLGVSGQTKAANAVRPYGNSADNTLRVDTAGVFEFDCASATFKINAAVGPAKAAGNALLSQTVVGVGSDTLAIGHVVEAGTSLTRVKVRIKSTLQPN